MEQFTQDIKNLEVTTVSRAQLLQTRKQLHFSLAEKHVLTVGNSQLHWLRSLLKLRHIFSLLIVKNLII